MTRIEIELDDEAQSALDAIREAGLDPQECVRAALRLAAAKKKGAKGDDSFLRKGGG